MQIVHIEALLMDNDELLMKGKSLGFIKLDEFKIVKRFDAVTGKEIKL